ncbi:unnamed protein product, partial [marine sediment metagenome]
AIAQVQIDQNFISQGPSPKFGPLQIVGSGDADNGANGTVAGAIQTILLDPMLGPNTMFIGSTNGGIWSTTDGGSTWTPLTNNQASLSIASLALDTTDPTGKTLIAGVGVTTSGNWGPPLGPGGRPTGLLYSTDGGADWAPLAGATAFADQSVIGVAARGQTILAATFEERDPTLTQANNGNSYGLYISTDSGSSFSLVPTCSPPCAGLPSGPVTALVADPDPAHSKTFYAAVTSPTDPTQSGVYVTHDSGAHWKPFFTGSTTVNG